MLGKWNRSLIRPVLGALALSLVVGGSVAFSASSGSATYSRLHAAGSLVVGYEADATSLDAAQPTDINTMHVLMQMYDQLVRWGSNGKLSPSLATGWKASKGGLRYTFTLRKGVHFSNGDPFNAQAVLFTFERMLNKNNPGYKYGPFPFGDFFFGDISSVKALGPNKVQFNLSSPNAGFLNGLTVATASIVDPKVALHDGKSFALHGAGTGPFMLSQWKRGVELILKPNPHYWGPKPKLRQVTFVPIVQPDQRTNQLKAGAVNLAINPAPVTLSGLKSSGYRVSMLPGPHIWWIGMNLKKPPFNKVLVRQALNYAIDRNAIIKGILYSTGIPADQPLAPGQIGFNPHVNHYAYNPAKAKQLLAKAGYPNGFSTTMLVPTSGSGMQDPTAMGTAIQGYLAAVGVKVKIEEVEWGTFLTKIGEGAAKANLDMWELSWMDSAVDPWLTLNPLVAKASWPPGFNTGFYQDSKVDTLLKAGLAQQNAARRNTIYQQAEAIINKDAPWIFVDHAKQVVAYDRSVQGFQLPKVFPFLINLSGVSNS